MVEIVPTIKLYKKGGCLSALSHSYSCGRKATERLINMSAELFWRTMQGEDVERVPVVPKIWIDLAGNLLHRDWRSLLSDPEYATVSVIEAAKMAQCDAARIFLFPRRYIEQHQDELIQADSHGRILGTVDIKGGFVTQLERQEDFHMDDPEMVLGHQFFHTPHPVISSEDDLKHLCIPTKKELQDLYQGIISRAQNSGGEDVYCIGDCGSGTMAFCISLMGMDNTLFSLYDNPELILAVMQKGIAITLETAKLMIDQGVRVLRYNDSAGNMSLLSPTMWRKFIAPNLTYFCKEVHSYCPEAKIYCHICGNILPILEDLIETGLDCIAPLDPLGGFSVAEIRQRTGDSVILMGGVNTLSFLNSTPQELEEECRNCIQEGYNGGRYILGSGCVVPRDTKLEQLFAMKQAAFNKSTIGT